MRARILLSSRLHCIVFCRFAAGSKKCEMALLSTQKNRNSSSLPPRSPKPQIEFEARPARGLIREIRALLKFIMLRCWWGFERLAFWEAGDLCFSLIEWVVSDGNTVTHAPFYRSDAFTFTQKKSKRLTKNNSVKCSFPGGEYAMCMFYGIRCL